MTERLHFHFSLSCFGEGNGNPLQCSCLENPRDGGAWWAAVYGVAQSRKDGEWHLFFQYNPYASIQIFTDYSLFTRYTLNYGKNIGGILNIMSNNTVTI